jgi:hypothetical protein
MSAQAMQPAKHYARMICKFMRDLPDRYADDPQTVRKALGLSDTEFKIGLDLCLKRGVIEIERKFGEESTADSSAGGERPSEPKPESRSVSPFSMDDDEMPESLNVFN